MPTTTAVRQDTRTALHTARLLVAGYAGISVLTLAAIVLLRDHPTIVTPAVWVRGTIVAVTSLFTWLFATRAAQGSRRAYLRLRIISVVLVVAIATIIALPGVFPVWMKIEQGVCGLVLLGVVVLVNGTGARSAFAAAPAARD